jgi:hypothetical protein
VWCVIACCYDERRGRCRQCWQQAGCKSSVYYSRGKLVLAAGKSKTAEQKSRQQQGRCWLVCVEKGRGRNAGSAGSRPGAAGVVSCSSCWLNRCKSSVYSSSGKLVLAVAENHSAQKQQESLLCCFVNCLNAKFVQKRRSRLLCMSFGSNLGAGWSCSSCWLKRCKSSVYCFNGKLVLAVGSAEQQPAQFIGVSQLALWRFKCNNHYFVCSGREGRTNCTSLTWQHTCCTHRGLHAAAPPVCHRHAQPPPTPPQALFL